MGKKMSFRAEGILSEMTFTNPNKTDFGNVYRPDEEGLRRILEALR